MFSLSFALLGFMNSQAEIFKAFYGFFTIAISVNSAKLVT